MLDYDPKTTTKQTELIVNTLLHLKNDAKFQNTLNSVNKVLTRMSKFVDLSNPDAVKTYIANAKTQDGKKDLSNETKSKCAYCYDCLVKAHGYTWKKPVYKWEPKAPLIPTKENVTKIISASTKRYATIFTILAETGLEGEELHQTPRKQIDTERGITSIDGHKGHASGTYELKPHTAEMLREYLAKNPQDYPFPRPKVMSQQWVKARNRLADSLKQPELKNIPMKSLRNYSGAQLYYLFPDPIALQCI